MQAIVRKASVVPALVGALLMAAVYGGAASVRPRGESAAALIGDDPPQMQGMAPRPGGTGVPELARAPVVVAERGKYEEDGVSKFSALPGEIVVFPIVWSLPVDAADCLQLEINENEASVYIHGTTHEAAQNSTEDVDEKGLFLVWFRVHSREVLDALGMKEQHDVAFTVWNTRDELVKKKYVFEIDNRPPSSTP